MTTLTGRKPKDTYKDLLQVSNSNAGIDSAPRAVEDGEGTASKLLLSTAGVEVDGTLDLDGEELVLDADGDTSITADTDDEIDVRIGGADVFKLAAAGAAGDKTWRLIESQTASGSAALDFTTGIDGTYDLYMLVLTDVLPATDGARLCIVVSQDGGATYKTGAADYRRHFFEAGTSLQGTHSSITVSGNAGNVLANETGISGTIRFHNPSVAGSTLFEGQSACITNSSIALIGQYAGYLELNQAPIDAIRVKCDAGNIASGTVALYGLKK